MRTSLGRLDGKGRQVDGLEGVHDLFAGGRGGQGDHDDDDAAHQEGGEQLVDAQAPPRGAMRYFQMKTMAPAQAIMPEMAPYLLVRFQNREKSRGPKEAPKPAQAKETMLNTVLLGSQARKMATMAMPMTVPRAACMAALRLSFRPKKSWIRSWDMLEAAAGSLESAVDMVEARMPASTTPAMMAKSTPCWLSRSDRRMMMVSASALEPRKGILPVWVTPRPTMPMRMAMNMEMTTHTVAIRREVLSLASSSMAMNRSRMWGMPECRPNPRPRWRRCSIPSGLACPVAGSYPWVMFRKPAGGVGGHQIPPASLLDAEEHDEDQSKGHNNALDQVRGGHGQVPAQHRVANDHGGADDHGGVIIHPKEAVEEGANRLEARGGIRG